MFTNKGYSVCRNDDCDEPAVAGRHGHRRCRVHHRELQKAQRRKRRARFDTELPDRIDRERVVELSKSQDEGAQA